MGQTSNKLNIPKQHNLAVLIPYSYGIWLYSRRGDEPLRNTHSFSYSSSSLKEVVELLCDLPQPRLATWLGAGPPSLLGDLLLNETELCVIPDSWVKHIPVHQTTERARLTAQMTEAFLRDPIKLFGRKLANNP